MTHTATLRELPLSLLIRTFNRIVHRRWRCTGFEWIEEPKGDGMLFHVLLTYEQRDEIPEKASVADRLELLRLGLVPNRFEGESCHE